MTPRDWGAIHSCQANMRSSRVLGCSKRCHRPPTLSPLMFRGTPKLASGLSGLPSSVSFPPDWAHSQEGKFLPQDSVFHVAAADSARTSADCPPFHPLLTPRAPDPTLLFFPKGQRLARLRLEAARSSGLPSGVPRLLSEGTRFITWLKSSNSKSPGRANPDLCNSMRTCESFGKGHGVSGNQRLV